MTEPTQPSGLKDIWERVQTTDPAFTKRFDRGAASLTAINPMYLVRKATEVWGPMGLGWGVDILSEGFTDGAPIIMTETQIVRSVVHFAHIRLWYIKDGKKGGVEQFGGTVFVGKSADGSIFTNDDAKKMSVTDATSKALSLLGFGSDVHLGLYDDLKYVADLETHFSAETPESVTGAVGNTGGDKARGTAKPAASTERYEQYKKQIQDGKIKTVEDAKALIENDTLLDKMQQSMLIALLKPAPARKGTNHVVEPFI